MSEEDIHVTQILLLQPTMVGTGNLDYYVGDAAQKKRGVLNLNYPVSHGVVVDWDDMEKVWNHAFYDQLVVDPKDHVTLLSETPKNPKSNREKMAQIMFETFGVPALYVSIQAVLSLYSDGRATGLVLDCGDDVTHCVPIANGYAFDDAIIRLDMGGRDLTQRLVTLLVEKGYAFPTQGDKEHVRDMKEKLCYVAYNYDKELERTSYSRVSHKEYTLPDGQTVSIGPERFQTPEILFDPSLVGLEYPGIHECVCKSIAKCPIDNRKSLYSHVILAGGTTMCPGFGDRLRRDVRNIVEKNSNVRVDVISPTHRKHAVWVGGSVLASISTFHESCVTKSDYDEGGMSRLWSKYWNLSTSKTSNLLLMDNCNA